MKFEWPDNPQEQKKYMALIAIVIIIFIVILWMFVISPFLKAKEEYEKIVNDFNVKLEEAQKEISKKNVEQRKNNNALMQINSISEKNMLSPILGKNYLLSAQPIIERHCRLVGISAKPPIEIGINDIIPPDASGKGATPATIKSYTARVTLTASYNEVLRFIRSLETENPYINISSLSIIGKPTDPERHSISCDIQWPIWANPEMAEKIKKQLKKGDEEENE